MSRKNLFGLIAAVAATAALCGRASATTPQHTADIQPEATSELDGARNAWLECVRAAIPKLDQPPATSIAVAHAAMDSCSDKYADVVRVLSHMLVPTCGQDSDCTRAALASAEREATQAATDEVTAARVRVAGAQVLECE